MRGTLECFLRRNPRMNPEENKFMFKFLLLNGLNLNLQLEDSVEKISIAEFVRTVRKKAEK